MIVMLGRPYYKLINVSDNLTSKRLNVCLLENFEFLQDYHVITSAQHGVYYSCYMHGVRIGLTNEQIVNIFIKWLDIKGISIENSDAFIDVLNKHVSGETL